MLLVSTFQDTEYFINVGTIGHRGYCVNIVYNCLADMNESHCWQCGVVQRALHKPAHSSTFESDDVDGEHPPPLGSTRQSPGIFALILGGIVLGYDQVRVYGFCWPYTQGYFIHKAQVLLRVQHDYCVGTIIYCRI